ncbi:NBS-LRR type resistance protein [Cucumis melo var. makuwa]|uniref:NBS-LRR type resistance protein n=1 Tax=Cucumis melo var. makuwa TaxID=1194695 RepID=A0A5A7V7E7_CUCMM|nr:NBS-LRR type resistance protein [Cucumis melo var. makuwa]
MNFCSNDIILRSAKVRAAQLSLAQQTSHFRGNTRWMARDIECNMEFTPTRFKSSGSVERTYQSSTPEGCTYQSSAPEGCTHQSSAPEGCTHQSSAPEGCTHQSSAPEGCTYP